MVTIATPLGAMWVARRRDFYRRGSTPIHADAYAALSPFFGPHLLRQTEVARVTHIGAPLPRLLHRWTPTGMLDLTTVRGMAFIDTIVVAESNRHEGDDETSLLFHELVHVAQFRLLGAAGFVRSYLAGWLGAGRNYAANPMERMAFELQHRFDRDPLTPFDAVADVRRRLGHPLRGATWPRANTP